MQPYVGAQVVEAKLSAMERTGKTKGGGDRERESRTGIKKIH